MLNRGSLTLIFVMGILLIVTTWYAANLSQIMPFLGAQLTNIGSLESGEIVQTNAVGGVAYQGSVVAATEAGNGDITFSGLNILSLSQTGPAWTLTSPSGMTEDHNNYIKLMGGVHLSRPGDGKNPPLQIITESALIDTNQKMITGSGQITFTETGTQNETQAVGFVALIQTKMIKLLDQVDSRYIQNNLLIHVTSKEAVVNAVKGLATYSGDVVVVQGERKLMSKTLTVHRGQNGQIESFVAIGKPAKTQDRPSEKSGMAYGQADNIYYYPGDALVKYVNQARFTQGGNVLMGDELNYNITTQVVSSPKVSQETGNTTIILPPYIDQKKGNS